MRVPDDVESGDLLHRFAITFGGKVGSNRCVLAACFRIFCRQRIEPLSFFIAMNPSYGAFPRAAGRLQAFFPGGQKHLVTIQEERK